MDAQIGFRSCHPAVCFMFFALVTAVTVTARSPVLLGASLISSLVCAGVMGGGGGLRGCVKTALPMGLMAAVINPAFTHEGATVLGYLPTGNPLTLESVVYGLYAAAMLMSAVVWFYCVNLVMTSDKLVYLFGRAAPALGLMLSMTLRFIPGFRARFALTLRARRGAGRDVSKSGLICRLTEAVTVFSIVVTWSLESAIETADSMRGRGYGLTGRTAYSTYIVTSRDRALAAWMGFCALVLLAGWASGGLYWRYYPTIRGAAVSPELVVPALFFLALCLTPAAVDIWEDIQWRSSM